MLCVYSGVMWCVYSRVMSVTLMSDLDCHCLLFGKCLLVHGSNFRFNQSSMVLNFDSEGRRKKGRPLEVCHRKLERKSMGV